MDEQDIFTAITKDPLVLDRLVRSVHRMRHEHGYLWEPQPGCGCAEWTDQLLANWDDENRTVKSDDCGDCGGHDDDDDECDDCGRTDGTHDDEVEH